VLRKLFGTKIGEVTGEWRKLHTVELLGFYCSPYILAMTKLRGIRLAETERAFARPRDI
jgi:hypothetical protein